MRHIFIYFSLLLVIFASACNNSSNPAKIAGDVETDSANFTQVQWADSTQDFGTVVKGEKVHLRYHCKNTGNKPMYIIYVRPSCGCTVADYTKSAIPPGGTGEVNAVYDSNHGIVGHITKTISVKTNTTNPSPLLLFSGTVLQAQTDSTKKSS